MKRERLARWMLTLGLAGAMLAAVPTNAQKGGRGGGRAPARAPAGHPAANHAPAHGGAVHYAGRPAPARPAPARAAPARPAAQRVGQVGRIGGVRAEHYAGLGHREGYRNPYRDDYFRRFRPGYTPFYIGDAQYYGYNDLPPDCQPVVIDGITYYLFDGVYYQPYMYGGQTVYLVAPF